MNAYLAGFYLSYILCSTSFPDKIIESITQKPIQSLAKERLNKLENFQTTHYKRHLYTFIFNIKCRRDFFSKLKYIFIKITFPTGGDIAVIALPTYLHFLYPIIRVFRLISKLLSHKSG